MKEDFGKREIEKLPSFIPEDFLDDFVNEGCSKMLQFKIGKKKSQQIELQSC